MNHDARAARRPNRAVENSSILTGGPGIFLESDESDDGSNG
jgi:hypothetical protein